MKREALIIDDYAGVAVTLVDILKENGYVVHVVTSNKRASLFLVEPAYIHIIENPTLHAISEALKDINFDNIEVAILSDVSNDNLNLILARFLKERGVPRVMMVTRDPRVAEEARDMGVEVIDVHHYIIARIQRLLSLKFSKLTPITGEIYMLEMLITGDSRILGKSVEDIEKTYTVDAVVVRDGRLMRSSDTILQAGDYLIVVGSRGSVHELLSHA